ncbi:hypothetical protein VFPFJ_04642 [Purpureocillium lilacinum]|uniref:Uncharacterized protein n=1 Tax=Purpureocillium lilacinum TaxID=33203 RepID=A0A179HKT2_PURLI|nr:hypothetical protein VFPFJ_04642 [Purpureocillium lilacinum]OAQ90482.1 hypothetical protein VFPFJ_04642 [Purpureocillium lilacinum]
MRALREQRGRGIKRPNAHAMDSSWVTDSGTSWMVDMHCGTRPGPLGLLKKACRASRVSCSREATMQTNYHYEFLTKGHLQEKKKRILVGLPSHGGECERVEG